MNKTKSTEPLLDQLAKIFDLTKIIIADLGCGYGRLSMFLSRKYGVPESNIVSLDLLTRSLKYAKMLVGSHVIIADVTKLPIKATSIDVIVCTQVIEHLQDEEVFVKEVYRILKKDGFIYVTTILNSRARQFFLMRFSRDHIREYKNVRQLTRLFKQFHIDNVLCRPIRFPLSHTLYHVLVRVGRLRLNPLILEKNNWLNRVFILPRLGLYSLDLLAKKTS